MTPWVGRISFAGPVRPQQRIPLTGVVEAGAGAADGEQEQAGREDRAGADPGAGDQRAQQPDAGDPDDAKL